MCAAGSQIVCAHPRDVGRLVVCQQGPPPPNPLVVERFQQVISQLFQQARRPACAAPWSAMERRGTLGAPWSAASPNRPALSRSRCKCLTLVCGQPCVLLQVSRVICCEGSEFFIVVYAVPVCDACVLLQIDSQLQTAPVRLRTAAEAPPLTRAARAADRAHGRAGGRRHGQLDRRAAPVPGLGRQAGHHHVRQLARRLRHGRRAALRPAARASDGVHSGDQGSLIQDVQVALLACARHVT